MNYYPPRFLFRRYEILKRLQHGQAFLEIGPGSLNLTADLLRYYQQGTLVDFNPEVAAIFEDLPPASRNRLELVVDDFLQVTLDKSFDCAVACEVMEHVRQDEVFLVKLHRLLEPRGRLILSVPAKMHYWSLHDEMVGHLRRYEKEVLLALLAKCGFEVVEFISYGYPFTSILRRLRIGLAQLESERRAEWTQIRQSQESGLATTRFRMGPLLGAIVNPFTVSPLCRVSSLFNRMDLSNGYLVFARKL